MPNRTTGHNQAAQEAMLDPVGLSASELETVSSWVAERILEDKQSLSIFHKQVMKRLFQNPEARKWLVDALVEEPSFVQTTMRVRNYILRGKLTFSEKVFDLLFEAKSILVASAAFVGILLMGRPEGLSVEGHRALAIFALTAILWVTEGLPLPVTSLLACVMFSLLNV
ncbi:MAG: anion permease, partial [bacterium]|nr:anion permease [bacterium]